MKGEKEETNEEMGAHRIPQTVGRNLGRATMWAGDARKQVLGCF